MFYCITFLNFLNSDQGDLTEPKRIKFIPEWPTPPSIRKIQGFHDLTNFYKRFVPCFSILVEPLIEWMRNHILSWEDGQEGAFQSLLYSNMPNITNTFVFILFTGVEERIHEFQEPLDLRSNPFQGGGKDAILPPKGIRQKTPRRLGQSCKRMPQGSYEPQGRFRVHGLSMSPLIFVHIRLRFH